MSLRSKIFLVILISAIPFAAIIVAIGHFIIYPSFIELERQEAAKDMDRSIQALEGEVDHLSIVCRDYAYWDEIYEYAVTKNSDFEKTNLAPEALQNLDLDFIYICDAQKNFLFGEFLRNGTSSTTPLPQFPRDALPPNHPLLNLPPARNHMDGILATPNGLMMVSVASILTSDKKGPSHGTLIMGKFIIDDLIRDLTSQTKVPIRIEYPLPPAINRRISPSPNQTAIKPISKDFLQSSAIVNDIQDKPTFLMHSQTPRHITAKGRNSLYFAALSICLAGGILVLIMILFFRRTVLDPIALLAGHAKKIEDTDDLSLRLNLTRKDEFGGLAEILNHMIHRLAEARKELLHNQEALEHRVEERTAELERLNEELRVELEMHQTLEKALHESEDRYSVLFETSLDGIIVCRMEDRKVLYANPSLCKMLSFQEDEMLRIPVERFCSESSVEKALGIFRALEECVETHLLEIEAVSKPGLPICVEVNATRATIDGQECAIGFVRDLTDRKKAEAEKSNLQEQLLHSQKMEAVGLLAGGVAHDFNNLLTSIIGHGEMILNDLDENDPLYTDALEIRKAGDRATALTRQLLAFSKKQVMQPKVINLNEVVGNLQKMLTRLIGENVVLDFSAAQGLGAIKADPGQIEQVVVNLAVNARDAMPNGGVLKIATNNMDLPSRHYAEFGAMESGSYVLLTVSDTGCGMDSATTARIFEPFFSTKGGKGTGLGLSTVYGIIQQSGGAIRLQSEVGRGTTFQIILPIVDEMPENLKSPHSASKDMLRGSETILLVEDEEMVRELVRDILRRIGYEILEARDPAEAIKISGNHRERIHLLLTDMIMPGMNGKELAEKIKAQRPDIQIVCMSGYTDNIIMHENSAGNGFKFIEKPFTAEALSTTIREAISA